MSDIFSMTYTELAMMGYEVRQHGTYAEGEQLPNTFVTYQLIDSPNASHADNRPTSTTYRVQVNLYSRDPELVQGADVAFRAALIPAGYMRAGGRGLPYNTATGHYGFTSDYRILGE